MKYVHIAHVSYLRNEFNFWSVHGIMNTSGLLQSYREARHFWNVHGIMNTFGSLAKLT